MDVTVEISLYPLHDNAEQSVLNFIEELKRHSTVSVETNGLSTQIFGEYDLIMTKILSEEIKKVLEKEKAVIIMKMGKGLLRYKG